MMIQHDQQFSIKQLEAMQLRPAKEDFERPAEEETKDLNEIMTPIHPSLLDTKEVPSEATKETDSAGWVARFDLPEHENKDRMRTTQQAIPDDAMVPPPLPPPRFFAESEPPSFDQAWSMSKFPFVCRFEDCKQEFGRMAELEEHQRTTHERTDAPTCTFCYRQFTRLVLLHQ
jgi:hypothetical protein